MPPRLRLTFMKTAASVSASQFLSSWSGNVPGRMVSTSSASTSGSPAAAADADTDVTPGTMTHVKRSLSRLCMCM